MIIQDQDKKHIYNSDNISIIAIGQDDKVREGAWIIGISMGRSMSTYMAVYSTEERAQLEADRLLEAFARDAKVYLMPEE